MIHKVDNVGIFGILKKCLKLLYRGNDNLALSSKHYDKCHFALKLIQLLTLYLINFHEQLYKIPTLPTLSIREKLDLKIGMDWVLPG